MNRTRRISVACIATLCLTAVASCSGGRDPGTAPEDSRQTRQDGPPAQIERTDPPTYRALPQGTYAPDGNSANEPGDETAAESPVRKTPVPELEGIGATADDDADSGGEAADGQ